MQKSETRADANAPISTNQINDLMYYLARSGVSLMTWWDRDGGVHCSFEGCEGCDRHVRSWSERELGDPEALIPWLDSLGCPCDCTLVEAIIDSRARGA